jgi:cell division ATPase FtsA
MAKNLNIVGRAVPVKGIASIGNCYAELDDFKDVVDPLSKNATCINKPASSIPSMFARILFFRTAFNNVSVNPTATDTVYAKYVSDCLYLLEDLFNRKSGMKLIKWDKNEQLKTLEEKNQVLHDALETQLEKFLPHVENIYLIEDNGQIVGGTSPRTVVYTSPNWINNRPVKMLTTRTKDFRKFMYCLAAAFCTNRDMDEFNSFINNSKKFDLDFCDTEFAGNWNTIKDKKGDIYQVYPPYEENNVPVIIDGPSNLELCGRDTNDFSSDFFVDSESQPFNKATTPLFLTEGIQPCMEYYSGNIGANIQFVENESPNGDQEQQQLPGCSFNHSYISPIYFLEDKLLKLPYEINENSWANVFKVNDKESCIVPLKPMFFKYFNINQLKELFSVNVDALSKKVIVTLMVPVRSVEEKGKNKIKVVKKYDFDNDIQEIPNYVPNKPSAFTIGVSPFYHFKKHFVIKQNQGEKDDIKLEFYKEGVGALKDADNDNGQQRSEAAISRSCYYEVGDFDYIRVSLLDGTHGVLVPIYKTIKNGSAKYYYGLDFGTTNTHIAFTRDNDDSVTSFNVNEFPLQVEYLSSKGETGSEEFLSTSTREFLPSNHNNEFSFPIRTVVSESGVLNDESIMFKNISIGFRYSKEYNKSLEYNKDLKWDYERTSSDEAVNARVRIFCEELLWIVKNHWMQQNDADHQVLPQIWLTYPLAMTNYNLLLQNIWIPAYKKIFEIRDEDESICDNKINKVTESLAPCCKIITKGALTTQGILNIDIGGGTTDFQYYCTAKNPPKSIYCSIFFAGDDLWGKGFENTGSDIGTDIKENNFTKFADDKLEANNVEIKVGSSKVKYKDLKLSNPKDKIDFLLKDKNNYFTNELRRAQSNDCRKIMYVHYASIMWHVVKWLKANGVEDIPQNISFTGLASKYLDLLFDTPERFSAFTKKLLEVFSGKDVNDIIINRNKNPKNVTAEGAALYARNKSVTTSDPSYHLGYDDYKVGDKVLFKNVDSKKTAVLESLNEFLEKFNSIGDCDNKLASSQVISLTDDEITRLKRDANDSFDEMKRIKAETADADNAAVNDSMFFWALKGSLWKL